MMMRLDKLLANYGIGTRKEVKSYIRKGFVKVDNITIKKDDYKVDYTKNKIEFDGEMVQYRPYVYLMLNKPQGCVSATKDNVHSTVIDLITDYDNYDLFPVGRLDLDTEGLLLITNDGDFAHKLLAPSRNHAKIYIAHVTGVVDNQDILSFKQGIVLDTGYKCKPAELKILETSSDSSIVEITIYEGKFHQVKKMIAACNKQVAYLKRIKIKNLELDQNLAPGNYRELSEIELVDLLNDL